MVRPSKLLSLYDKLILDIQLVKVMVATTFINRIDVQAGQRLHLHDLTWQEFEQILTELGEKRATRIAYYDGDLEIRMPLPEHELAKVVISDLLKILLEELDIDWMSLGSSTFKNKLMKAGIEPDDCFYVKNCRTMIGKKRLDMTVDPPPELAIEVDLTSRTQVNAYAALGVAEVWQHRNGKLVIFILNDGEYIESASSLVFPNVPVIEGISQILNRSNELLMSEARKEFRKWIKQAIN
jgi:Uma2 family endonuclease